MGRERLYQALQDLGYRLTPQRLMVLEIIAESTDHISAEDIYDRVRARYPHINISTIYRTLDLLNQLGLVTVTDMGDGRISYHYADKGHHHHLICHRCGTKLELDESLLGPLKKTLMKEYGFQADLRHLAIFGRCRDCQK
jgi:Fur family ferric uptake transcriptional regulator